MKTSVSIPSNLTSCDKAAGFGAKFLTKDGKKVAIVLKTGGVNCIPFTDYDSIYYYISYSWNNYNKTTSLYDILDILANTSKIPITEINSLDAVGYCVTSRYCYGGGPAVKIDDVILIVT